MKKFKITVEDIQTSAEYAETAKMLQRIYDRTGFIPSLFDCISPPETERNIEDNNQQMQKPGDIDLYVAERWITREGDGMVIWVTTEIIKPVMLGTVGQKIKYL